MTDRAQNLGDRRDAFEKMRDLAADAYRVETGDTWPAPRIAHEPDRHAHLRRHRRTRLPTRTQGPRDKGAPARGHPGRHHRRQDRRRCRRGLEHPRHGPREVRRHGPAAWRRSGVEKIAASWAEARGVNQIVCRPDWNAHGKAAPFRRNRRACSTCCPGRDRFPGSGITGNLVDKAPTLGIPVMQIAA